MPTTFPLKEGDVWSSPATASRPRKLHSNYFEAFCFARYPILKFAFRNSGVGGHTLKSTMDRFSYDIAAWKPTVVSIELGMNDKGGSTVEQYMSNMGKMTEMIRAIKARPVYFTASAVNNGDTMARLGGNARLHEHVPSPSATPPPSENAPFADQFHGLLDIWGKNKPGREPAEHSHPHPQQRGEGRQARAASSICAPSSRCTRKAARS